MDFLQQLKKIHKKISQRVTLLDGIFVAFFLLFLITFSLFFKRDVLMVPIRVKVTDQDVLYAFSQPQSWYADAFTIGDVEIDTLGKQLAVITGIERFGITNTSKSVYLDMNVRVTYDNRTKQYTFKGKPLSFGTPLRFSLNKIFFDAVIVQSPETKKDSSNQIVLTIEATKTSVPSFIATTLVAQKGKSILNKDGGEWLRIDTVKSKPSQAVFQFIKETQNERGFYSDKDQADLRLIVDSDYHDVHMSITIYAKEIDNTFYVYEDIPVKIGETIPINFPEITFLPTVTNIQKVASPQ